MVKYQRFSTSSTSFFFVCHHPSSPQNTRSVPVLHQFFFKKTRLLRAACTSVLPWFEMFCSPSFSSRNQVRSMLEQLTTCTETSKVLDYPSRAFTVVTLLPLSPSSQKKLDCFVVLPGPLARKAAQDTRLVLEPRLAAPKARSDSAWNRGHRQQREGTKKVNTGSNERLKIEELLLRRSVK